MSQHWHCFVGPRRLVQALQPLGDAGHRRRVMPGARRLHAPDPGVQLEQGVQEHALVELLAALLVQRPVPPGVGDGRQRFVRSPVSAIRRNRLISELVGRR